MQIINEIELINCNNYFSLQIHTQTEETQEETRDASEIQFESAIIST